MELVNRLDNVIKRDKQINPQYMKEVIKSDIYYVLNNYFEVQFDDIDISIDLTDNNNTPRMAFELYSKSVLLMVI